MTDPDDHGTFAERLMTVRAAVMQWAVPKGLKRGDGSPNMLGCLNPLTIIKIAVTLVMVALLPVFMLPLLWIRIAMTADRRSSKARS